MNNKKIQGIIIVAIGILAIIFAIICFNLSTGSYADSYSYGGDAYTGIQNAAARTANNTRYVSNSVQQGFGFLFLLIGLTEMTVGVFKIIGETKIKELASAIKNDQGKVMDSNQPTTVNEGSSAVDVSVDDQTVEEVIEDSPQIPVEEVIEDSPQI